MDHNFLPDLVHNYFMLPMKCKINQVSFNTLLTLSKIIHHVPYITLIDILQLIELGSFN